MTIVANQMGGWAGKMAITTQTRLDHPAFLRWHSSEQVGVMDVIRFLNKQFGLGCPWPCDFISDFNGNVESVPIMLTNAKTPRREVHWLSSFLLLSTVIAWPEGWAGESRRQSLVTPLLLLSAELTRMLVSSPFAFSKLHGSASPCPGSDSTHS